MSLRQHELPKYLKVTAKQVKVLKAFMHFPPGHELSKEMLWRVCGDRNVSSRIIGLRKRGFVSTRKWYFWTLIRLAPLTDALMDLGILEPLASWAISDPWGPKDSPQATVTLRRHRFQVPTDGSWRPIMGILCLNQPWLPY